MRVGRLPSLELDVDTPGDLEALRAALRARRGGASAHARAARAAGQRGVRLAPLPGLPEVRPGDDLAALLAAAGARLDPPLGPADVLVVAHKVVSKAEGRVRALADVEPRRERSSSPPSTARTRATSRRSSTRLSSSCAPTAAA